MGLFVIQPYFYINWLIHIFPLYVDIVSSSQIDCFQCTEDREGVSVAEAKTNLGKREPLTCPYEGYISFLWLWQFLSFSKYYGRC